MLEVRLLMKTNKLIALIALLIVLLSLSLSTASAQEELPVVHAIMFYSPYCPHCEKVINQDLPPLFDQYGDQLVVVGIDVSNDAAYSGICNSVLSSFTPMKVSMKRAPRACFRGLV